MSKSTSRKVALLFLLALALPATVLAETKDTADLKGVVLDASGRPASGYPMKLATPQWGDVVMHPTEDNGSFAVSGLPPGSYELRVFEPGGSPDNPIASKQVTLAAGQAEQLEIRVGSAKSGAASASKSPARRRPTGTTLAASTANWTAVLIGALVIAAGLVVFFAMRSQRRPGERGSS